MYFVLWLLVFCTLFIFILVVYNWFDPLRFVEPSPTSGRSLPHLMPTNMWCKLVMVQIFKMVMTCVSILDSVSFWVWRFCCLFPHVAVQCFPMSFDFEVAFHGREVSGDFKLVAAPKAASASAWHKPLEVKVCRKHELLVEGQVAFALKLFFSLFDNDPVVFVKFHCCFPVLWSTSRMELERVPELAENAVMVLQVTFFGCMLLNGCFQVVL